MHREQFKKKVCNKCENKKCLNEDITDIDDYFDEDTCYSKYLEETISELIIDIYEKCLGLGEIDWDLCLENKCKYIEYCKQVNNHIPGIGKKV